MNETETISKRKRQGYGETILYNDLVNFRLGLVELFLRVETPCPSVSPGEVFVGRYETVENIVRVDSFRNERVSVREEFADEDMGAHREEGAHETRHAVNVLGVTDVDAAVERVDHAGHVGRNRDEESSDGCEVEATFVT